MQKIIFLSGFMGSGKTSVGQALAQILGWPFADTDELIAQRSGFTVLEIFGKFGEAHFRNLETQVLRSLKAPLIVSLGGGAVLSWVNREILKKGHWFFLRTSPGVIEKRLDQDVSRPLLQGGDKRLKIESLLRSRAPYYSLAPHTIFTDHLTPEAIASRIASVVRASP